MTVCPPNCANPVIILSLFSNNLSPLSSKKCSKKLFKKSEADGRDGCCEIYSLLSIGISDKANSFTFSFLFS